MAETHMESSAGASSAGRTLRLVSLSHFLSHIYLLLLPPLFVAIQAETGWSYTKISFAIVAFYLVSTVLQTPAGYVTDRFSPFIVLVGGICLEALAFGLSGFAPNYYAFIILFGIAGIGNTVFHPAHYAILANRIPEKRMAHAYSVHTFAGFLGTAAAPVSLHALSSLVGWRGALGIAGLVGLLVAVVLVVGRSYLVETPRSKHEQSQREQGSGMAVLLRPGILVSLVIFALLAASNSGVQGYVATALVKAWGTPLADANTALSAFLVSNAIGVLLGGVVSRYVRSQEVLFSIGLAVVAASAGALAFLDIGLIGLIGVMTLGGLANGIILPSRDLIVRSMTPDGQFGKVFGFVSTGFFIGATLTPPAFALFLDQGRPAAVFVAVALINLFCIVLTASVALHRPRS